MKIKFREQIFPLDVILASSQNLNKISGNLDFKSTSFVDEKYWKNIFNS